MRPVLLLRRIINALGYDVIKTTKRTDEFHIKINQMYALVKETFSNYTDNKTAIMRLFDLQHLIDNEINRACLAYYDGKHPKHHLWMSHYQFLIDNVDQHATVFDIGSGLSLSYITKLATKCKEIYCCDKRTDYIKQSKEQNQYSNVHFFTMDITKTLPSRKFDITILSHVLEHLNDPVDVLNRLKQITSRLLIRLPRYDDHWMYLVKKDLGLDYFKDKDHKREYTLEEAKALIHNSGWTIRQALNDVDIKIEAIISSKGEK